MQKGNQDWISTGPMIFPRHSSQNNQRRILLWLLCLQASVLRKDNNSTAYAQSNCCMGFPVTVVEIPKEGYQNDNPTSYSQNDYSSSASVCASSGTTTIERHTHRAIAVRASQSQSLKYPKGDIRTAIQRHTHRMIIAPRPLCVCPQEEQQLH